MRLKSNQLKHRINFAFNIAMIFSLSCALFLGLLLSHFFLPLTDLSGALQSLCLESTPFSSHSSIYQSLVCGARPSPNSDFYNIKNLGLFHLFIISGAHLQLLSTVLKKLLGKNSIRHLRLPLLFLYVLICNLQLPVLRAWIYLTLSAISDQKKLFLSSLDKLLISILFCLAFKPSTWSSSSLMLSWLACLGLISTSGAFKQCFLCYGLLFPVLKLFAPLSPLSIVANLTLGPVVGSLLFPLSLLCFLVSPLTPLVDFLWQIFLTFSSFIAPYFANSLQLYQEAPRIELWIYCGAIHILIRYLKRPIHE